MASALINGSGSSSFHFHVHTTDWHILFLGFYIVTFSLTLSDIESWLFWLWRVRFLYFFGFVHWFLVPFGNFASFCRLTMLIGFDCAHLYYFQGLRLSMFFFFFFKSRLRSDGVQLGEATGTLWFGQAQSIVSVAIIHHVLCFTQDILVEFTFLWNGSIVVWSNQMANTARAMSTEY